MLRKLLIVATIFLASCSTKPVVVKYVEKDKLNLGPIAELKLNRTTEWYQHNEEYAIISMHNLQQHFEDLTKILDYQLQLKTQLKQLKDYYQEN